NVVADEAHALHQIAGDVEVRERSLDVGLVGASDAVGRDRLSDDGSGIVAAVRARRERERLAAAERAPALSQRSGDRGEAERRAGAELAVAVVELLRQEELVLTEVIRGPAGAVLVVVRVADERNDG